MGRKRWWLAHILMPCDSRGLSDTFHQNVTAWAVRAHTALSLACLQQEVAWGLGALILAETLIIMLRSFISASISAFIVMV